MDDRLAFRYARNTDVEKAADNGAKYESDKKSIIIGTHRGAKNKKFLGFN